MSFRNRCIIAGAGGTVSLSIPLEFGRTQKSVITEVSIANKYPWQQQHWKTIISCYGRAPWFEYYAPELEKFYSKKYDLLVDLNLDLFRWVVEKLGLSIEISPTKKYDPKPDQIDTLDLRNLILPKSYSTFSAKPYYQVFSDRLGFLPNLSVLDLLLCEGKAAINFL